MFFSSRKAGRTYEVLEACTYASKALGNFAFPDDDSMQCDCTYSHGSFPSSFPPLSLFFQEKREFLNLFLLFLTWVDLDNVDQACGEDAQCMNRLMQIECVEGDCKCRKHCQNQRFVSLFFLQHISTLPFSLDFVFLNGLVVWFY